MDLVATESALTSLPSLLFFLVALGLPLFVLLGALVAYFEDRPVPALDRRPKAAPGTRGARWPV